MFGFVNYTLCAKQGSPALHCTALCYNEVFSLKKMKPPGPAAAQCSRAMATTALGTVYDSLFFTYFTVSCLS